MKWTVSETAKRTGVSVRTLHYYDSIGLLKPAEVRGSGYRYYDEESLQTLQQILFFRELEFSLRDIRNMLQSPLYDKRLAMKRQRELLICRRRHIDALIALADETMGENTMKKVTTTAEELSRVKAQYAAEAKEKWGATSAYQESVKREAARSGAEESVMAAEADAIFAVFAEKRGCDPTAPEVQELVKRWQDHISHWYYPCTAEILAGLGQMYVGDDRFTQNLDRFGAGVADLMSRAIAVYCQK